MNDISSILILDFGSPYTQFLARLTREIGIYSTILPYTASVEQIYAANPGALIVTGGTDDACAPNAPSLHPAILAMQKPILGIGFGLPLISLAFHGTATPSPPASSYKSEIFSQREPSALWEGIPDKPFEVWTSDDSLISTIPKGFRCIGWLDSHPVAIADESKKIYALQFHPEVPESQYGRTILKNFLFSIAGLPANWSLSSFISETVRKTQDKVKKENVILGLSGGVDSTVSAALLHKAIGAQLHCIFVDTGLMRFNEAKEVLAALRSYLPDLNLHHVNAEQIFLNRLEKIDDPEEKRKIIGHSFIEVFDQEAKKIDRVAFLAQGTVYSDVIESFSPKGHTIKSHHNVGGLPEKMHLQLLEPVRELFKNEVRAIGLELGVPEELIWRHPFPGPGLAIRILGAVTKKRLETLRLADHIVQDELRKANWHRKVWQAFAVLLPLRTVGISDSGRTYKNVLAIRAVNSVDAMTADWVRLPESILDSMAQRILQETNEINRVVYDISPKPPSTIEWE